jgi:hypothetical protein
MKNFKSILLIKSILIIASIFLFTCCSSPQKYYFKCSQQKPEIIHTYIPNVLYEMDYKDIKIDEKKHSFIAQKRIISTNMRKGIQTEYFQLQINYKFDTTQSVIIPHYIIDLNGKQKKIVLTKEQSVICEKDILKFKEKMIFYCNPKFQGR